MSKSVEQKNVELEATKVALEATVAKLAGENDTYTTRMKEMEDSISKAMERMKCMEDKMGEYAKAKSLLDDKMETTAKSLAEINIVNEESDEEEGEEGEEGSEDGEEEGVMKGENNLQGINEKVIAGIKKKKGKKAKKATTTSAPEEIGTAVNEKFDAEKEKSASAVEAPVAQAVVETPAPVAEVVVPTAVAEEVKIETVAKSVEAQVATATIEKLAEVALKVASTDKRFNELDAEISKAQTTLALEAKIKMEANATIKALADKYEALLAKVASIESNNQSVEAKVAKTISSLGVEPVSSSVSETEVASKTAQDILKEWEGIRDPKVARAFYVSNREAITEATFPKKK